ncbi:hypothetical protein B0T18DRAFT_388685 [Schizothecium vesticola]|uniref:DUF8212 domain-containing protein n=1 Tax=Schizothecium vesticola TaxID=314040 RepID=A0AA40F0P5_9PEZI|nr:hypothetical protein B0T18DRAFT_388685 [Schizothecium vesticola]
MFQWYQNSKVCYVYLEDLLALPVTLKDFDFDFGSIFQACPPRRLLFYDATWAAVGDRHSLADSVWCRTNIPVEYLQTDRQDFHRARVGQRMSWASDRNTTRKEDMAYCLLGIFDINMPLLYGEGHRAFRRLQDEILKTSTDDSIFAWTTGDCVPNMGGLDGLWPEEEDEPRTPLAPSPHAFRCLRHCAVPYFWRPEKTWETSSDGIRIRLPICSPGARPNSYYSRSREQCKVGLLNCALGGSTNKHLAIVFRRNGRGNDWERITLCTVNCEHLAAARRDTLDVREPGTDAIHEVNRGENWPRLDGLLINIVADRDYIVSKHVRDHLTTWIRTWIRMGLRIRKGGLKEPAAGSDYIVSSIRTAKHRDLCLLGAFTHVVEIDEPGKDAITQTTEHLGVPAALLVSEPTPEELYLALFAALICLGLISEKATQAKSRAHVILIMLSPLVLILCSHLRVLHVVLVDTDKPAQQHREELWK